MERYQVILAYDGTDFHGSQYQTEVRTVQGVFETALRKLNWAGKSTLFAGRTDASVHALGQVVAFDFDWSHPLEDLQNALNATLPEDVAVFDVAVCGPDFHPRFDAVSRTYRYRLFFQAYRHPLRERYAWRVWPKPAFPVMEAAADLFVGVHDFAAFGGPTRPGGSTIRDVMAANWQLKEDELIFHVRANAFLYHMVRRLAIVQVMAGQGKIEVDEISNHIENPQGPPVQGLAPPQGLSLVEVNYSKTGEN